MWLAGRPLSMPPGVGRGYLAGRSARRLPCDAEVSATILSAHTSGPPTRRFRRHRGLRPSRGVERP